MSDILLQNQPTKDLIKAEESYWLHCLRTHSELCVLACTLVNTYGRFIFKSGNSVTWWIGHHWSVKQLQTQEFSHTCCNVPAALMYLHQEKKKKAFAVIGQNLSLSHMFDQSFSLMAGLQRQPRWPKTSLFKMSTAELQLKTQIQIPHIHTCNLSRWPCCLSVIKPSLWSGYCFTLHAGVFIWERISLIFNGLGIFPISFCLWSAGNSISVFCVLYLLHLNTTFVFAEVQQIVQM